MLKAIALAGAVFFASAFVPAANATSKPLKGTSSAPAPKQPAPQGFCPWAC